MSDSVLKPCLWCQDGETEFKNNQHWTGTRYHVNSVDLVHWCGDGSAVMPRRRIVITAKTREECVAAWNTRVTDPLLDEMAEVMGKIEKYYDFPGEVLEEIAPEWLIDVIQVMKKYREHQSLTNPNPQPPQP